MAASRLPKPGTEYGPCADACSHVDCIVIRNMARSMCHYCETEIGFEIRFYQLEDKSLVHANCHEEAIEKEQDSTYTQEYDTFTDADPGL